MSSALTLQNAINFATPILKNQPLQVSMQEPALTGGNIVLGAMLGPPMRWRFNRSEISFAITPANTDYVRSVPTLGWIEATWLKDGSGTVHAMNGEVILPVDGNVARPGKLAPQFDDNQGNVTFRVDKTPDQNYTCYVDFQNKMKPMNSAASTWSPVPDEFEYIFNHGFLALMSLLVNDARFPIFENYFIARLLGAQDGLGEQARNIFLMNWANAMSTLKRADGAVTQGVAGRGR